MRAYYQDPTRGLTLYLGDCRAVLPHVDRVDHVITDPPYARDVYHRLSLPATKRGSGTPERLGPRLARLAAGAIGSVDELLANVAGEVARITARWALVFSDVETCHRWRDALDRSGMRYVRTGAWVKTDAMPQFSGDRPAVGFEPCTIAHAPRPMRWNGGGRPAVWTHGTVKGALRPEHPCPKPLPLMRELVRLFSDPGELILDPFAGSGTTLVAARLEGRCAIGVEIDEAWAEAAARRLERGEEEARRPEQGMPGAAD